MSGSGRDRINPVPEKPMGHFGSLFLFEFSEEPWLCPACEEVNDESLEEEGSFWLCDLLVL